MNRRIVLDADGVLLDYRLAYPMAYERAFGKQLPLVRPDAYHAHNAYGLAPFEKGTDDHQRFFDAFDDEVWAQMPEMEGATEACQLLHAVGIELVCVTSMPLRYVDARRRNFKLLGMPLVGVHATGRHGEGNPKLELLQQLAPEAFVDNLASNFDGVPASTHRALVDFGEYDSPNRELDCSAVDSRHAGLLAFTRWWLARHP